MKFFGISIITIFVFFTFIGIGSFTAEHGEITRDELWNIQQNTTTQLNNIYNSTNSTIAKYYIAGSKSSIKPIYQTMMFGYDVTKKYPVLKFWNDYIFSKTFMISLVVLLAFIPIIYTRKWWLFRR